jgi:3-hydroxyisobutyrate dehydrogenase-like beta-hydroxyacid dehydrogenase
MAKLGFLGLGIMGAPMAQHLIAAGHNVALWSHTADKATQLAATAGGFACATPAEVAKHSNYVFLCVGNTQMSREVILGADGLVSGAAPGLVIVDCSTVSPAESRAIASELAAKGIHFLDAPCTIALMLESAADLGVPLPLTALSQQLYRAAIAKGYGEEDICGSIRVLEELSGCEVSAPTRAKAV